MKCDVLVVGASPAGLMAAITAARSNADVILVDRDLGSLNHPANTIFEGMAARTQIDIQDCYVQKELQGMRILSPSGHGATIPARGYFLDREKLDQHYLAAAEAAGVSLLRDEVGCINRHPGRISISSAEGEIKARVAIDASGIGSHLSQQAGLQPMRHPQDIAWAMEADVSHPGLGEEMFFSYWIGSMAPGWKATFSPAGGDRATLAVFVRGHGPNVQSFFRSFLKIFKAYKSPAYRDIEELKILSVRRGGDPIAVLPGQVVSDSLMVTGGAAGQSGLAYSMRAGQICGQVAADAISSGNVSRRALSEYAKLWNAEFYWEYRMGRAALETLADMKDGDIDRLVQRLSGKALLSEGGLYKKSIYAGARVALARPRTVLDLAWNLARG
jgi:digeranylgeranylglycerophospholipid reductase